VSSLALAQNSPVTTLFALSYIKSKSEEVRKGIDKGNSKVLAI